MRVGTPFRTLCDIQQCRAAQCNSVRPTYSRARRAARGVVVGAPARGPLLLTRPAAIKDVCTYLFVNVW